MSLLIELNAVFVKTINDSSSHDAYAYQSTNAVATDETQ